MHPGQADLGNIVKARQYIAAGADINFVDDVDIQAPLGVPVSGKWWTARRTPLCYAYATSNSAVLQLLLACGAVSDISISRAQPLNNKQQQNCGGRMLRLSEGPANEIIVSEAAQPDFTLREHVIRREQGNLESLWQWVCDVRGVKNTASASAIACC